MKLTFYCRECIKRGRTKTVRWANLRYFLRHMWRKHGLRPAERSER